MKRRDMLRTALAAGAVTVGVLPAGPASAGDKKKPGPDQTRDVAYRQWTTGGELATGELDGTAVTDDAVTLASPIATLDYTDPATGSTATYEYATWTSVDIFPGFAATEVIPSWTADTPGGAWIQVELRGTTNTGETTKWYNMGRWAADDNQIRRTSVPAQGDTHGYVAVDTFVAREGYGLTSYRLRVTLLRPAGAGGGPALRSIGAVGSALPEPDKKLSPSSPLAARGVVLDVPRYSQHLHDGHYPEWNGGGEAWCSPTSTSMVVAYWGTGPTPEEYAWVEPQIDPWVDFAARNTYDYSYDGCGNWPFNTAYAGRFGLDGLVTRLRSLNEAELFIAAGIPLVLSLSFKKNEIPGLTYGTGGHLLVLVGFAADGSPVLNDPAAVDDDAVRKTVGRAEFETAWLNTSRGVAYVMHPDSVPLPPAPAQANW
jgi:hypothetical protein